MPDAREVAQKIIDLLKEPRIDADTPLEDLHLLEQIADIVDDALTEEYREGRAEGERNERVA